nr:MATE family efflux transporter [Halarchaeum sp. CBA1220]
MDSRLVATWRRVLALAWPVMASQTLRTLMRTVDVLVTATFSPAAVVAVGLADLYGRIPLRIGLGFGSAAIALASQDTGADADANRAEAVSSALVMGLLAGVPIALCGVSFGGPLIRLFGASGATVALGATYLAVVLATAPARHVSLVASRALQGTGDTRTPMYVTGVTNLTNITGSLVLGLGLLGVASYGVLGVAAATAASNVLSAALLVATIHSRKDDLALVRPRDLVVARQLLAVAAPKIAEGFATTLAEFPFNALLLGFGTPVNAGFQIGRRVYQQVTGPLSRGYRTAVGVLVGHALGDGDPGEARYRGWATTGLAVATVGTIGLALVALAPDAVRLLAGGSPDALPYATSFARVYGYTAAFVAAFTVLSGALGGASETRIPLFARTTGVFGGLVGGTYALGVVLGWGPLGAYVAVGGQYVWMAAVAFVSFACSDWARRATDMMAERGSTTPDD